jgi:hypothetical protein
VADIEIGGKNESSAYQRDGEVSIGIGIVAQATANPLEMAEGVKGEVARLQQFLPQGAVLIVDYDSTQFIRQAIDEVYVTLGITALLVMLVLYLFLGQWRATLIPAVTVPISLIAACIGAWYFGFSINMLTLLALILAIGLVVDDAIVVVENIHHHLEQGRPPLLAAWYGTKEVGFAVVATTLVLMMIFLPILFMPGMIGRLFTEFSLFLALAIFFHNMGIHSYIDPVPALCLGTSESNVYEMVSAFSTFANEGVYTTPIFVTRIEDRQGNLIASFAPRTQDAISEHTAYTMLTMLEGVIRSGTGGRLGWAYNMQNVEVGGKTGTSQKNRDAWFMCVLPKLVAGCWVGGEDQAVRLVSRGEGSVIALPIVGEFLNRIYADPSTGISKQDLFTRPAVMPVYDCDETEKTDDSATRYEEDEFFE